MFERSGVLFCLLADAQFRLQKKPGIMSFLLSHRLPGMRSLLSRTSAPVGICCAELMLSMHAEQSFAKIPKRTTLADRPLRLRHRVLCKTHKRVFRKCESHKLWGMSGDSSATRVKDLTSRKKALSDMYEDSKNAFPDVCKFELKKQYRNLMI